MLILTPVMHGLLIRRGTNLVQIHGVGSAMEVASGPVHLEWVATVIFTSGRVVMMCHHFLHGLLLVVLLLSRFIENKEYGAPETNIVLFRHAEITRGYHQLLVQAQQLVKIPHRPRRSNISLAQFVAFELQRVRQMRLFKDTIARILAKQ